MDNKVQAFAATLVGKPLFWIALVLSIASFPVTRALLNPLPPPPPVLGAVPDFSLVDQDGRPFAAEDLRGKVWIADFIFTRCPSICPAMTTVMSQVQHRSRNLGSAFRLVSISIDPEHDTPAALRAYAEKYAFSPRMWTFATGGSSKDIQKMVSDGFKIAAGQNGDGKDPGDIFHGSHFVLVDAAMHIRGYYDSTDKEAVDRLLRDAGLLLSREPRPAVAQSGG